MQKSVAIVILKHYVGLIVLIDADVRATILDCTRSFIVQAPAGSGKTTLLISRMLSLLLTVNHPEQILALTFTKKATHEMQERLLEILFAALNDEIYKFPANIIELSKNVLKHAQIHNWNILDNPSRLKIKTFDSLCSAIVAKMPYLSGLGINNKILDTPWLTYILVVENFCIQNSQDPDFKYIVTAFENDHKKIVQELCKILSNRQQWLDFILSTKVSNATDVESNELLFLELEAILEQEVKQYLLSLQQSILDLDCELLQELLNICYSNVILTEPFNASLSEFLKIKNLIFTSKDTLRSRIDKKFIPHELDRKKLSQICAKLDGTRFAAQLLLIDYIPEPVYSLDERGFLTSIANLLLKLITEFAVLSESTGKTDFAQVAMAANIALGHRLAPTELALELDYHLQHILVDEFQDTSISQMQLLNKLTANWENVKDKTIFFVGDPMQSIYRFRQADVSIFLDVAFNGFNGIKINFVKLQANFRSQPAIVDFINNVCSYFFPKQDDKAVGAVKYTPAIAYKKEKFNAEPAVNCFVTEQTGLAIIELIKRNNGKDIAILVQGRNQLRDIIPYLNTAGIKYTGVDLSLLIEQDVVVDLISITKILVDYTDKIALFSVLRSPAVGIDLLGLKVLAENEVNVLNMQNIFDKNLLSDDADARLKYFYYIFHDVIVMSNKSIYAMLKELYLKLLRSVYCDENELSYASQYFLFLDRYITQNHLFDINDFLTTIENEYVSISEATANVQIMTIHKSKGLEFDVVIVPNIDIKVGLADSPVLITDNRLYAVKNNNLNVGKIYSLLKYKDKIQNNFELMRLFYVAMSRAKSNLYLLSTQQEQASVGTFANLIGGYLSKFEILDLQNTHLTNTDKIADKKQYRINIDEIKKYHNTVCNNISNKIYEKHDVANSIAMPMVDLNLHREIGIVLHSVLKKIVLLGIDNVLADPNKVQTILNYVVRQFKFNYQQEIAKSCIKQILVTDFARTILSNNYDESYVEWPVVDKFNNQYSNYIIDRAYVKDNILHIIEYKFCSSVELKQKIEQFVKQVQNYVFIIKKMQKYQDVKASIYLLQQGELLSV